MCVCVYVCVCMCVCVCVCVCNARDTGVTGLIPGSGRSPEGGKRQPTPVFLHEKFYGHVK